MPRDESNHFGLQMCQLLWQLDLSYSVRIDAAIRSLKYTFFFFLLRVGLNLINLEAHCVMGMCVKKEET